MPLEKYTTLKGKSLASAHRTRLLQFSAQIYNCLPWLDVHPGRARLPARPATARTTTAISLRGSTWTSARRPTFAALPQERRVSAMFSRYGVDMLRRMSALAECVDDRDVAGLSVVLTWRKPDTTRPGRQAVNETFSLFIDKATALDFLAKRVSPEEFLNRAKFNLFDGQDRVGRVPIEIWEDSFNSTYKATNVAPPKGAVCP